jgi:hypothetical protein
VPRVPCAVVSIPTSYAASPIAPASRQLVQLLRKDNNVSNAETQSQGTTSARTSLLYVSFWKEKNKYSRATDLLTHVNQKAAKRRYNICIIISLFRNQ